MYLHLKSCIKEMSTSCNSRLTALIAGNWSQPQFKFDARMQQAEGSCLLVSLCSLLFKLRQSSCTTHRCKLENSWSSMWNFSMLLLLKHLSIKDWIQVAQPFEEAVINSTRKCLWKTSPSDLQASWPQIPPWKRKPKGAMENSLLNNGSLEIIVLCHSNSPLKKVPFLVHPTSHCCSQAWHSQQKLLLLKIHILLRGKLPTLQWDFMKNVNYESCWFVEQCFIIIS